MPYNDDDVLPLTEEGMVKEEVRIATQSQLDSLCGLVEVDSSRTSSLIRCKFVDPADPTPQLKGISTGPFLMRQFHLWFQLTVSVSWLGSLK